MKSNFWLVKWLFLALLMVSTISWSVFAFRQRNSSFDKTTIDLPQDKVITEITPTVLITETPTATPTPRPLTFAEMNSLYGPCVNLPILMYHHTRPSEEAKAVNQTSLNVSPDMFRSQMKYLKDKGYTSILPKDLINFFDNGVTLPTKSIMITLDDGYRDNYDFAFPILKELGMKATVFIPTGLMQVNDYMTWNQITEMQSSGLLYFGNHTWSHLNVASSREKVKTEIETARNQLADHGLDESKVFAYPYGINNGSAVELLKNEGYTLAFTTKYGRVQCAKQRLLLPRMRIGETKLSNYGL